MSIGILFDTVLRYLRYRENVSCSAQLDERILRDIGLSRSELCAAAWARCGALTLQLSRNAKRPAMTSRAFTCGPWLAGLGLSDAGQLVSA